MPEIPISSLAPRLQKQVDNARTAVDRGNTEYAINICREILSKNPGCLPVRRLLRAAQLKIFKSKNRFLAKAVGMVKSTPGLLAAQSWLKKNPARAIDAAERALDSDPTNAGVLKVLAQAALALDLPETAAFCLETVREHAPNKPAVLIALADAYIAASHSREALAIAERLLGENPGSVVYQDLVKRASVAQSITSGKWDSGSGTFRDKLRDEQQAVSIEQSNKVVTSEGMSLRLVKESIARSELEPANLNHYRAIVGGYRSLGQLDDALEWLAKARLLPMGAADPTLEKLESDLRSLRVENQIKQRTTIVTTSGGDVAADAEILRLRSELTQLRIGDLRSLVEKYPNEHGYKFELGTLLFQTGQIDQAIQQFQAAQRLPKLRIASLTHLGACFKAKGLHDLAVQQYETAKGELLSFDDEKKEITYALATCYEAMGRPERALEEYKQIYSWDISFRDVAAKVGGSYNKS